MFERDYHPTAERLALDLFSSTIVNWVTIYIIKEFFSIGNTYILWREANVFTVYICLSVCQSILGQF